MRTGIKRRRIPGPPQYDCHHLVKKLFCIMRERRVTYAELSDMTGISDLTIRQWKYNHAPSVTKIDECFTALGYALRAQPVALETTDDR